MGFAFAGIAGAFRREVSFRWHITAAVLLFLFCLIQRPPALWCALFAVIASLVMALELLNTALEALIDKLHPGHDKEIGFAKDCLAGAVLVASLTSLVTFILYCSTLINT